MQKKTLILIAGLLILFGVVVRFVPHDPNMTPITALAFAASLYLGRRWAFIIPITVLLLSDFLIGPYEWSVMLSVYGSFTLIALLGVIAARYRSLFSTGLLVISSSFIFFLITNAAVWASSPWYEKNVAGLLYSYELGLPFLRNMLIGDLLYTATLVGLFEVCCHVYQRRWRAWSTFGKAPAPLIS
jgi:hypothetical protein